MKFISYYYPNTPTALNGTAQILQTTAKVPCVSHPAENTLHIAPQPSILYISHRSRVCFTYRTAAERNKWNMKTKVKELRIAAGLTQQQLADAVHVSARTIISIEKELYKPSLMLAYRMAQLFHTTIEDLCCLEENKKKEDEAYAKI